MEKGRIKALVFAAVATLCTTAVPVQSSQGGLLFLTIEPGGRPTGMGNAYIAEANDVSASYWNPAGLAFADSTRQQFFFSFSNWIPMLKDIYHAFFAYERHVSGWGTFGTYFTYMSYGEMERTGYGGEYLGKFRSQEYVLDACYADKIVEDLSVGIGFKFIYSDLFPGDQITPEAAAAGFAVDLGFTRKNIFAKRDSTGEVLQGLALATVLQNVGDDVYYINADKKNPLPQHIKVGAAYKIRQRIKGEENKFNELNLLCDIKKPLVSRYEDVSFIEALISSWTDERWDIELKSLEWNLGAEYWYASWIGLRSGYKMELKQIDGWEINSPPSTLTFGASLNYEAGRNRYLFDISYMPSAGITKDTHRFSLTIDF
jgi:hypothetical protein